MTRRTVFFFQIDEDILFFNERCIRGEFQIMFDELNSEKLRTELLTTIKQLRNGASSGPDLLLNEFFKKKKKRSETLVTYVYLHNLFNKLFQMGYFPENLSEGFIVPTFNKTCRRTGQLARDALFLSEAFWNLISIHTKHDSNQSKALQQLTL